MPPRTSNHTLSLHVHVGRKGYWGHCPDDCLEKEVGSCSDYGRRGFKCVHPDVCDQMCEVITDGSGPSNPFTVRASEFGPGCQSDKRCSGVNEVCCRDVALSEVAETTETTTTVTTTTTTTTPPTTTNPEDDRLVELESDVIEALERVKKALEEVRGNEKAVSLLEKISSTLVSVLDKLSTLMLGKESVGNLTPRFAFNELVTNLNLGPETETDSVNDGVKRLLELESEVKETLETVKKALEEVKGEEKAVSHLENIRSTLESVLDKLSTLIEASVDYDDLTPRHTEHGRTDTSRIVFE